MAKVNKPKKNGINIGYNPVKDINTAVKEVLSTQKDNESKWIMNKQTEELLRHTMGMYPNVSQPPRLTGEKELTLNGHQLMDKLQHNTKGLLYMKAFEVYLELMMHIGILAVIKREYLSFIYIPDWDLFITALDVYTIMHGNI